MLPQSKSPRLNLVSAGFWESQSKRTVERFELLTAPTGWWLRGTIVQMDDAESAEARYEIRCDSAWRTESADIVLRTSGAHLDLNVRVESGHWYENGRINESVDGCIDIDLGWSPSTNTLPIRRLNLAVGQASGSLTAAWVSFPDLTLQPLAQEYSRLADQRYLYMSNGGSFKAELLVDKEGLVVDYDNLWRRVDRGSTSPSNQLA